MSQVIKALEDKLTEKNKKLDELDREQIEIENEIQGIKKEIASLEIKLQTEILTTGLYYAGYTLKTEDGVHLLMSSENETVHTFRYSPSLTELFELEKELISQVNLP